MRAKPLDGRKSLTRRCCSVGRECIKYAYGEATLCQRPELEKRQTVDPLETKNQTDLSYHIRRAIGSQHQECDGNDSSRGDHMVKKDGSLRRKRKPMPQYGHIQEQMYQQISCEADKHAYFYP